MVFERSVEADLVVRPANEPLSTQEEQQQESCHQSPGKDVGCGLHTRRLNNSRGKGQKKHMDVIAVLQRLRKRTLTSEEFSVPIPIADEAGLDLCQEISPQKGIPLFQEKESSPDRSSQILQLLTSSSLSSPPFPRQHVVPHVPDLKGRFSSEKIHASKSPVFASKCDMSGKNNSLTRTCDSLDCDRSLKSLKQLQQLHRSGQHKQNETGAPPVVLLCSMSLDFLPEREVLLQNNSRSTSGTYRSDVSGNAASSFRSSSAESWAGIKGHHGAWLHNALLKLIDQFTIQEDDTSTDHGSSIKSPGRFSGAMNLLSSPTRRVKNSVRSLLERSSGEKRRALFKKDRSTPGTSPLMSLARLTDTWDFKEDADPETLNGGWLVHWKVILRSVFLVLLALTDFIMGIVQLLWGVDDLYCAHLVDQQQSVIIASPRWSVVIFMSVLLTLYMFNLVLNITEAYRQGRFKSQYKNLNLQTMTSGHRLTYLVMRIGSMVQGVPVFFVEGFVLIFSFVIIWWQFLMCFSFTFYSARLNYFLVVVTRTQLVVHFLRSITLLKRCLEVRSDVRRRLQAAVSMNKRRFIDPTNQLDLDLTYVCDRLIAMAVPCVEGAVYRNDITEVSRFFATRHYGSFLVYNLCEPHEENGNGNYDTRLLYGQVQKLPFKDHNAPPLDWLVRYCEQASAWLNVQSSSVVAVHCQGGKGRTGTFCSALLLWTHTCHTSREALTYYKTRRTDERFVNFKKPMEVSSPSQKRYVEYIEIMMVDSVRDYKAPQLKVLQNITLSTLPFSGLKDKAGLAMTFYIENQGQILYQHCKFNDFIKLDDKKDGDWKLSIDVEHLALKGDVCIRFFYFQSSSILGDIMKSFKNTGESMKVDDGARTIRVRGEVGKSLCFVTFHTSFHKDNVLSFSRAQVDGAHDHPSIFPYDFKIQLSFLEHKNPTSQRFRGESLSHLGEVPAAAAAATT